MRIIPLRSALSVFSSQLSVKTDLELRHHSLLRRNPLHDESSVALALPTEVDHFPVAAFPIRKHRHMFHLKTPAALVFENAHRVHWAQGLWTIHFDQSALRRWILERGNIDGTHVASLAGQRHRHATSTWRTSDPADLSAGLREAGARSEGGQRCGEVKRPLTARRNVGAEERPRGRLGHQCRRPGAREQVRDRIQATVNRAILFQQPS
jgi:hypothetical protein